MAEKIQIKIETTGGEKIAENINKANESAKSLKQQLREMTQELQNLEPGTKKFNDLTAAAGQLKDQIADTNAAIQATAGSGVENLAKGFSGVATTGIAAFQGITSAQALFGVESEALQETLVKLNALAGLASAAESLGGLGDTITNVKAAFAAAAVQLGLFTTAKETDAVVTGAQALATEGATVAQTGLNVAMLANPVFLLVAGIAALVAAFVIFGGKSKEQEAQEKKRKLALEAAAKAQKEEAESVAKSSTEFVGLIYQLKETNYKSKERKELIDQLNSQYGLTLKNIKDETGFTEQLNIAVEDYITIQRNKYKIDKNAKYFQDALAKENELQTEQAKLMKIYNTDRLKAGTTLTVWNSTLQANELITLTAAQTLGSFRDKNTEFNAQLLKVEAQLGKTADKMKSLTQRGMELKGQNDELTEGGKKYEDQEDNNRKAEEAREKALDKKNKRIQEAQQRQEDYNNALTAYYDLLEKNRQDDLVGREKALQDIANSYDEQIAIADKAGQSTTEITARYTKQQATINKEWDDKEKAELDEKNKNIAEKKKAQDDLFFELTKTARERDIKAVEDASVEKMKVADGDGVIMAAIAEDTRIKIAEINKKYDEEELAKQQEINQKKADIYSNLSNVIKDLRMEESGWVNDLLTTALDGISSFTTLSKQKFDSLTEKVNAYAQAIGGTLQGIIGAVTESNKQKLEENLTDIQSYSDSEKALLEAQYNNGTLLKADYDKAISDLDKASKQKEYDERKKAFDKEKKTKIASATIAGLQGAIAAFTGAMSLGPIAGPIVGGLLVGAVAAMTAMNISKIQATKFDSPSPGGGGGGGGVGGGSGTSTATSAPTPPSINFFGKGNEGSEGGNQQGLGQRQTSIRAYVVESEITTSQNTISTYQQRSEIG